MQFLEQAWKNKCEVLMKDVPIREVQARVKMIRFRGNFLQKIAQVRALESSLF
jgi:hypothetical protein